MFEKVKKYFEERGVTAADIPKAIVVHNLLGAAFMVMTWGAFYQIQPSQRPMFAPMKRAVTNSNKAVVVKMRQSYKIVVSEAERRMAPQWMEKRGIDSGRVAVSFAESTLFRKLAKPVTIPGKFWLTFKVIETTNVGERKARSSSGDEDLTMTQAAPPGGRSSGEEGRGWGTRLGLGGKRRRRRRAAICNPFGGGGAGCFVVPVRQPVYAEAATAGGLSHGRRVGGS
ncbi:unnamed protein product [Sphacelaria rigidula]